MTALRPASILILVLVLTGCSASSRIIDEPQDAQFVRVDERPYPNPIPTPAAFEAAIERGSRTRDGRPGAAYWTQDTAYRINVRLDPEARTVHGNAVIRYVNNSPDRLEWLHLELAQNLHAEGVVRNDPAEVTGGVALQRVEVNGETLEPAQAGARYIVDGTQLILVPSQAVSSGDVAEIEIEWEFAVPQAGAGGRMGYDADNLFFIAYWYPTISVYDDVYGWHMAPFQGTAEFYHGFGDYDVTIEMPGGWLVHATGELDAPDDILAPDVLERLQAAASSDVPMRIWTPGEDGSPTRAAAEEWVSWRFTARQVRDFAFSATRESIWDAARTPVGDRTGDGEMDYAVINTLYRESAPFWAETTDFQQHAIAFLSSYTRFPYPWPHMTAVEGGNIIGGGMEFPMITLMGDYNQRGEEALYHVTAHELAHMWVPMIAGSNERRYTWLDEGVTTFNENMARMDYYPGFNHHLPDQETYTRYATIAEETEMMRPSDYHEPGPSFVVASYMKPASVLVALREVLGEEVFDRALREYIRNWAYAHPYPHDFFNTFERVSGRDLDWFWRTWYYETWTLDQAVESVSQQGDNVSITIRDHGEAPMPVIVQLTLDDGSTASHRAPVDVWLDGSTTTTMEVRAGRPVVQVEIDPEHHFPDVDRANNVWTREP